MLLWWSKPSDPPLVWSDPSRVCLAVFFEPWHCFRCGAVLPWVVLPSTRMSLRLFHVNQSGSCGDRHSFWFLRLDLHLAHRLHWSQQVPGFVQ